MEFDRNRCSEIPPASFAGEPAGSRATHPSSLALVYRIVGSALFVLAALPAHAYCVYNQLPDREVRIEQEPHPDKLRDDRRLRATVKPGANHCCPFHRLDCNPGGRNNSVVNIAVTIPGEPVYECGFPEGAEPNVKVTGAGTIRIMRNPRTKSAYPYIVRVRTHDRQDLTGPTGLMCPESRSKGKK